MIQQTHLETEKIIKLTHNTKMTSLIYDPHCDVCSKPLSKDSFSVYKVLDSCMLCYDKIHPLVHQFADALSIPKTGDKDKIIEDLDKYTELERTQFAVNGLNILKSKPELIQQFVLCKNDRLLYSALLHLLIYRGLTEN